MAGMSYSNCSRRLEIIVTVWCRLFWRRNGFQKCAEILRLDVPKGALILVSLQHVHSEHFQENRRHGHKNVFGNAELLGSHS